MLSTRDVERITGRHRCTIYRWVCAGTFPEKRAGGGRGRLRQQVQAAAADGDIERIVLLIDSGVGAVEQIPENSDAIYTARSAKPVLAYSDGLCASAAFWLGSQAHRVLMLGSGEAGSVGVCAVHVSYAQANEMAGIEVTHLTSSPFKSEGNDAEPLGDQLGHSK